MSRLLGNLLAAVCLLTAAERLGAIEIQFDYRYDTGGFFSDPTARTALDAAAATFESVLLDDLSAISASGSNTWEARTFNPASPHSGVDAILPNLAVPADTLVIFAGGADLGSETLGIGGPGGFGGSGISQSWFDTLYSRGQGGQSAVQGMFAHEFGPWGGSITFDTQRSNGQPRNWHFDVSTDPARDTADFYSVAVHELAHVLGFGTAQSFANLAQTGYFEGAQAKSLNNNERIRMNADNSHWAADTRSPPWDEEGPVTAMDPSLITVNGFMRRRHFTPLDFAALDDLGWTVDPSVYVSQPEPLPGDYNDNGLVEQADLDLVLGNWGRSGASVPSTWVSNPPVGTVDQAELDGVLSNWGAQRTSAAQAFAASTAVPEPATWLLGGVLVGALAAAAATGSGRSAAKSARGVA